MNGVKYVPTTLRNIKIGEMFCTDPDSPDKHIRTMAEVTTCRSRPNQHIHLGSGCYWLDAPVYRVVVSQSRSRSVTR